jgi:hypothetical protein
MRACPIRPTHRPSPSGPDFPCDPTAARPHSSLLSYSLSMSIDRARFVPPRFAVPPLVVSLAAIAIDVGPCPGTTGMSRSIRLLSRAFRRLSGRRSPTTRFLSRRHVAPRATYVKASRHHTSKKIFHLLTISGLGPPCRRDRRGPAADLRSADDGPCSGHRTIPRSHTHATTTPRKPAAG